VWHGSGMLSAELVTALTGMWDNATEDEKTDPAKTSPFFQFAPRHLIEDNSSKDFSARKRVLILSNGSDIGWVYKSLGRVVEELIQRKLLLSLPIQGVNAALVEYLGSERGVMDNVGYHYDITGRLRDACDEYTATVTLKGSGVIHYPDYPEENTHSMLFICNSGDLQVHENTSKSRHCTTNFPPRRLIASFHFHLDHTQGQSSSSESDSGEKKKKSKNPRSTIRRR
jgi:hypothetical protein